jgi:hypothetical protein
MMPEPPVHPIEWSAEPEDYGWQWRKCRDVGFTFALWPLDWRLFMVTRFSDHAAWTRDLHIGPFVFGIAFNIGWKTV